MDTNDRSQPAQTTALPEYCSCSSEEDESAEEFVIQLDAHRILREKTWSRLTTMSTVGRRRRRNSKARLKEFLRYYKNERLLLEEEFRRSRTGAAPSKSDGRW
jgi:hypothetical protein